MWEETSSDNSRWISCLLEEKLIFKFITSNACHLISTSLFTWLNYSGCDWVLKLVDLGDERRVCIRGEMRREVWIALLAPYLKQFYNLEIWNSLSFFLVYLLKKIISTNIQKHSLFIINEIELEDMWWEINCFYTFVT